MGFNSVKLSSPSRVGTELARSEIHLSFILEYELSHETKHMCRVNYDTREVILCDKLPDKFHKLAKKKSLNYLEQYLKATKEYSLRGGAE